MVIRVSVKKIFLNPDMLRVISNFFEEKPILITGAPRSGTTWVGKMLSFPKNVVYISEPFVNKRISPVLHPYITDENGEPYLNILKKIVLLDVLKMERLEFKNLYWEKDKIIPVYMLLRKLIYFRFFSGKKIIPLIKDPNAIFSAEWFEKSFNIRVVITIRHPAGFVSSLKRLGWRTDFSIYLKQERLMKDYLWQFEKEMRKPNKDIIYEGALVWKCFYYVVDKYRQKHPDWIFIRHEDLCRNPVKEFMNLYERLKLPFSPQIRKEITDFSSPKNPIEPPNNEVNYLKRNSKSLIKQWKQRLTPEEIKRIRNITGELWHKFYKEDEW